MVTKKFLFCGREGDLDLFKKGTKILHNTSEEFIVCKSFLTPEKNIYFQQKVSLKPSPEEIKKYSENGLCSLAQKTIFVFQGFSVIY
jgi:hypothetical protein